MAVSPLLAQAQSAEFGFVLHYSETSDFVQTLTFGYDSRATYGKDALFGEEDFPAFGGPPGAGAVYFTYDDSVIAQQSTGTRIDILPKPQNDGALQYQFHLYGGTYPAHLVWDRTKIPSIVRSIQVTPASATNMVMLDMTKASSFDIDIMHNTMDIHDYSNWKDAVITIYYNMDPGQQGGVADAGQTTALLGTVTPYPNPIGVSGALLVNTNDMASLTVTGFDAAGRECFRAFKQVSAGSNSLDLKGLMNCAGAIMLHVEATSGSRHETRNVMVVKD